VSETLALIASAATGPSLDAQLAVERAAQLRRISSLAALSAQG
jgi:hypothetical protein